MEKSCSSIPCPSFDEYTLVVTAVCDCGTTYPWGNPWGHEDCPIHGALVRDHMRRDQDMH